MAAGLAQTAENDRPQVAIVVAGQQLSSPPSSSVPARSPPTRAPSCASRRTTADQLGVTHVLAASGYDEVITVGVDRRIAIAPVAARYPETRFVEALREHAEVGPGSNRSSSSGCATLPRWRDAKTTAG